MFLHIFMGNRNLEYVCNLKERENISPMVPTPKGTLDMHAGVSPKQMHVLWCESFCIHDAGGS